MLGAGFDQLVLDEALVDRQGGDRVDLLVCLHQLAPGVVAVERQRVREVPRELGVLQGEEREEEFGICGATPRRNWNFRAARRSRTAHA